MSSNLYRFFLLLLLRCKPQDIPYSSQVAIYTAFAYVLTGVLVLQSTIQPAHVVQGMILGLFVQLVFTWAILSSMQRQARFIQTITAMLGVSMMFNLLSWPIFYRLADVPVDESVQQTMSLLFLLLISWEVLVKAYIYRYAMEIQMASALLLSLCLLFVSFALTQMLLPQPT